MGIARLEKLQIIWVRLLPTKRLFRHKVWALRGISCIILRHTLTFHSRHFITRSRPSIWESPKVAPQRKVAPCQEVALGHCCLILYITSCFWVRFLPIQDFFSHKVWAYRGITSVALRRPLTNYFRQIATSANCS